MPTFRRAVLLLVGVVYGSAAATAQAPVAVVEEVESRSAGVEFMDYLTPGQVIRLSPGDAIVIGYMQSCWRENIQGGTVIVGSEQSSVDGGTVDRTKIRCNGGQMRLATEQAEKSGALSFRRAASKSPLPQRTVHSLSPIIEVKTPGKLVIERTDKPGERYEIDVTAAKLLRGAFFDLGQESVLLAANGLYHVKTPSADVTIKIAPDARRDGVPVIARLVRQP